MTTITTLPVAPNSNTDDAPTFNAKANALVAALNQYVNEANLVASETNTASSSAAQSATNASAASNAASSAANATKWAAATTYQNGQVVYSPITYQSYRRKVAAGTDTIDPSQDPNTWVQITGVGSPDYLLINQGVA